MWFTFEQKWVSRLVIGGKCSHCSSLHTRPSYHITPGWPTYRSQMRQHVFTAYITLILSHYRWAKLVHAILVWQLCIVCEYLATAGGVFWDRVVSVDGQAHGHQCSQDRSWAGHMECSSNGGILSDTCQSMHPVISIRQSKLSLALSIIMDHVV